MENSSKQWVQSSTEISDAKNNTVDKNVAQADVLPAKTSIC